MRTRRSEHPLALLFWSQIGLAYALPIGLETAERWRGYPDRGLGMVAAVWPMAMAMVGALVLLVDFAAIYGFVVPRARRWPGIVSGAIYAIFVFLALALTQAGPRNARMAWADYVADGVVTGLLVLLVALAVEVMASCIVVCQLVAFVRRWRRLARLASPAAAQ